MSFEEIDKFISKNEYPVLLSEEKIKKRVEELGRQLSHDYRGKCPILIGVLNGSFMFCGDLFRNITIDCEIDFIKISSYGNARQSSGQVKVRKDIDAHLEGRHVILVEDIVDSGLSVQYLRNRISRVAVSSLRFVSLLVKEGAAKVPCEIDYVGFTIPNRFVVGYGLDFAQKLRNLPAVFLMEKQTN
jgi:hypoxanthine phosphoribosyltransferase